MTKAMPKNIVLIGFMGSGKTTIGRLLSIKFNRPFVDCDNMIEEQVGMSINEIFQNFSEHYFRNIESELIKSLSHSYNSIISTGGGVVKNPENMASLRKNAYIVYLESSPLQVFENIQGDQSRPLLLTEDPFSQIKKLMNERTPLYKTACDFSVSVVNRNTCDIVCEICTKLEEFCREN